MKKIILAFGIFISAILASSAQDYNIGLRITPMNSSYYVDNMTGSMQNFPVTGLMKNRSDSLTLGLSYQKYFQKRGLLLKVDISYAYYNLAQVENETYNDGSDIETQNFSQWENQKYYNLNLGLGNRITFGKFKFSFGGYIPIYLVTKGSVRRVVDEYDNWVHMSNIDCTGTYKNTIIPGVGVFADFTTVLFKRLTVGVDFTYQVQYFVSKMVWTGTEQYYGTPAYTDIDNETVNNRSLYSSKITPSLLIEYYFSGKNNSEKLF